MAAFRLFALAFLVLALAAGGSSALAQEQFPEDGNRGPSGAGFFSVGAHLVDLDALNNRLSGEGYPTFEETMFSVGGGGYGVIADGILIGGEGYANISGMESFEGRDVTVGGGYGLFNLGYVFEILPELRFYPLGGIGGGALALDIGSEPADSFDDVLEDPDRRASMARASFLASLGAGAEVVLGADGGFMLGVRAGYMFAPSSASWRINGDSLTGGPGSTLEGPFIRLLLGGAGR